MNTPTATTPTDKAPPSNNNAFADVEQLPVTPTAAVTQTQSTSSTPRIQSQDCDTPPLTPLHQVFNIPPSPDMIRMSLPPASPEPSLALTATPSASTTGAGTGIQVPSKRKEPANNLEDGAVGRADDV